MRCVRSALVGEPFKILKYRCDEIPMTGIVRRECRGIQILVQLKYNLAELPSDGRRFFK